MKHRILELYSGIGGMHCAWNESEINGEIIAAIDINTIANEVYKFNFPSTNLMNRNIQSIPVQEINDLHFDTILMSPPCQPFTRNGKYLDENDPRTNSFVYLIEHLDQFETLQYMLIENVKGFERSNVRDLLINKLVECQFQYQEFLLCPSSFGVPNSRLRYYCIAKKSTSPWQFERSNEIKRNDREATVSFLTFAITGMLTNFHAKSAEYSIYLGLHVENGAVLTEVNTSRIVAYVDVASNLVSSLNVVVNRKTIITNRNDKFSRLKMMKLLPKDYGIPYTLENILEKDVSDKFLLNTKLLKHANILDITYKESRRSCCFTKAYTHYLEGTGSVYTNATSEIVNKCYEKANTFEIDSDNFTDTLKQLNLRFFTPNEVLLLMSFPANYQFPETISLKQCYRLIGNSINVKVVSELIKLLFNKYF